MKIKMDLLPNKYKCIPRDYMGIGIAAISVVLCITIITLVWLTKSFEYSREKSVIESPVLAIQQEIRTLDDEIASIKKRIEGVSFDPMLKMRLVQEIKQFNQIRKDFQWSGFFQAIEIATPDQVWIKDFTFSPSSSSNMMSFDLRCEASDGIIPIKFYQNLLQGPRAYSFKDVILGEKLFSENTLTVHFAVKFTYISGISGEQERKT